MIYFKKNIADKDNADWSRYALTNQSPTFRFVVKRLMSLTFVLIKLSNTMHFCFQISNRRGIQVWTDVKVVLIVNVACKFIYNVND